MYRSSSPLNRLQQWNSWKPPETIRRFSVLCQRCESSLSFIFACGDNSHMRHLHLWRLCFDHNANGIFMLSLFFFFFCSEFHWQQQKDGGRITFASHMSLKSVLGVLLLPRRIRQKTSCFFFSSPPFFSGRSLVNKQQTSTKKSQSDPAVN